MPVKMSKSGTRYVVPKVKEVTKEKVKRGWKPTGKGSRKKMTTSDGYMKR